jgi:hypothetical protein
VLGLSLLVEKRVEVIFAGCIKRELGSIIKFQSRVEVAVKEFKVVFSCAERVVEIKF